MLWMRPSIQIIMKTRRVGLHVALAAVRSYLNRIPDGHLMPAINDPTAAMRCEG